MEKKLKIWQKRWEVLEAEEGICNLVESVFGKGRSSNGMIQFSKGRSKRTASLIISM